MRLDVLLKDMSKSSQLKEEVAEGIPMACIR